MIFLASPVEVFSSICEFITDKVTDFVSAFLGENVPMEYLRERNDSSKYVRNAHLHNFTSDSVIKTISPIVVQFGNCCICNRKKISLASPFTIRVEKNWKCFWQVF